MDEKRVMEPIKFEMSEPSLKLGDLSELKPARQSSASLGKSDSESNSIDLIEVEKSYC